MFLKCEGELQKVAQRQTCPNSFECSLLLQTTANRQRSCYYYHHCCCFRLRCCWFYNGLQDAGWKFHQIKPCATLTSLPGARCDFSLSLSFLKKELFFLSFFLIFLSFFLIFLSFSERFENKRPQGMKENQKVIYTLSHTIQLQFWYANAHHRCLHYGRSTSSCALKSGKLFCHSGC